MELQHSIQLNKKIREVLLDRFRCDLLKQTGKIIDIIFGGEGQVSVYDPSEPEADLICTEAYFLSATVQSVSIEASNDEMVYVTLSFCPCHSEIARPCIVDKENPNWENLDYTRRISITPDSIQVSMGLPREFGGDEQRLTFKEEDMWCYTAIYFNGGGGGLWEFPVGTITSALVGDRLPVMGSKYVPD